MKTNNEDQIEVGDKVIVSLQDSYFNATVLHVATATGECWRFRESDASLVYVQNFESITLLAKA